MYRKAQAFLFLECKLMNSWFKISYAQFYLIHNIMVMNENFLGDHQWEH